MKNIKAVIFDCDGVLFDTAKANRAYYNRILNHLGKPELTDRDFHYVQMYTVHESLEYLFHDPEELEKAYAFKKGMGYKSFIPVMEMEPYLKRLLDKIRPAYKTAIATNRTDTMDEVVRVFGLDASFDAILCASDVERAKPYPDMLEMAVRRLELSAKDAVYVGDSEVDEKAAKAAGMPFIAFKNKELNAWKHMDNLGELESLLLNAN